MRLSSLFDGVAWKRLSAVEALRERSNQHEFDGVNTLRGLLGPDRLEGLPAHFIYLGDGEDARFSAEGFVTWYDARERHATRSEYRLYYSDSPVSARAAEGDLLVVGRRSDGSILVLIVASGSTAEQQVRWLFGLPKEPGKGFTVRDLRDSAAEVGVAERFILESLDVEIGEEEPGFVGLLEERFPEGFPDTRSLSRFARETVGAVSPDQPSDETVLEWFAREELLFRTLERKVVGEMVAKGFAGVDDFLEFSLSVQNRRKSRAGLALEHHLEEIFIRSDVKYSRGEPTENRSRPDFLFPGIRQYRDPEFPAARLSMLGAKATCKDRWRQVLSEAQRIDEKHLFTMEPSISRNQTDEMAANGLRLVVPRPLHKTYLAEQQRWLLDLDGFIGIVRERQEP